MFRSGGHVNAAIRRVKAEIPTYSDLHLPPIFQELISRTNEGLILVVGITGSGKSSTLAAMIEQINQNEACNIITVEDPVEYRFHPKKSIISQREIGVDVPDYKTALRYIVRQDPDVIFIGEMRDHDTVLAAIQAAETGHLVFATLHTADTMQSFNRMLEFFSQEEHAFIRSSLSNTMRAILAQRLLPAVEGFEVGVVPATEVLINTPIVQEKIREGEENDLPSIINSSGGEGMMSTTKSLADLVKKEWVTARTAMAYAPNRDALDSELKGVEVKAQTLVHRIKAGGKG
jgi:twitching motility protein PilT